MDSESGSLRVRDRRKVRPTDPHRFQVSVSDGKYTSEAEVVINWTPVSPSELSFQKNYYEGAVLENSGQRITVGVLCLSGAQLNEHITFSILNPLQEFTIGQTSGALRTTGVPLDRELKETYLLIVQAVSEEGAGARKVARVEVNITVLDVNDNCPVVINPEIHATVSSSARKHHVITRVMAVDADKGENGEVRYELEEGRSDLFRVCPKSGNVSLKQLLTGAHNKYLLTVAAHDNGITPCTRRAKVHITVIDGETPVFEREYYAAAVPENIPLHSVVPVSINAESPLNNDIMFTISEGDEYQQFQTHFNIGNINGMRPCIIMVEDVLDYETKSDYFLTIRATDTIAGKYSEIPLHVTVMDSNDNPPIFDEAFYNISVLESLQVGSLVLSVSANDNDTGLNSLIHYMLEPRESDSPSLFNINAEDGGIYLKRFLDYETKVLHHLVVRAVDSGIPALSSSVHVWINVVDILDTSPQLEGPFSARICNSQPQRGQFVSHIRSTYTEEGPLIYALLTPTYEFHLDKYNGFLTIANADNLTSTSYILNISISDGVYTSFSHIKVDMLATNIRSPRFDKPVYKIGVKENEEPGNFIVKLTANDEDPDDVRGSISYAIVSEFLSSLFFINSTSGEVRNKVRLDREETSFYEIPVIARDKGGRTGFTTLCVTVTDVNDNAPMFLSESVALAIYANATVNTPLVQIFAVDKDEGISGMIEYSIYHIGNDEFEIFMVDGNTGYLSIVSPLEGLENNVYEFFVKATDKGSPPLQSELPLSIYIVSPEDPIPIFDNEANSFYISEATEIGSIITIVKLSTNMKVRYYLEGPSSVLFNINERGQITVALPLDREEKALHAITVKCETELSPPIKTSRLIKIHVLDVNDNKPVFHSSNYKVYVYEDVLPGTLLTKVIAEDKDDGNNGSVSYWLEDSTGLFAVDRITGWLSVVGPLDREKQSEYLIALVAGDNGNPVLTDKTFIQVSLIDVNDNPPVFVKGLWNISISEDAAVGTKLAQLYTTDADDIPSRLEYFITSGDVYTQFKINATGEMFTMRKLNREHVDNYNLTVIVSDGKFSAFTTVVINVLDVNDEPPQCLQHVYTVDLSEAVQFGTYITTVKAYDPDLMPRLSYGLSGNDSDYFSVDELTGEIRTKGLLDREKQAVFSFIALVSDNERLNLSCSSRIIINLLDVNDNSPNFRTSNLTTSLLENSPAGSLVIKLHAIDADLGMNSKVRYVLIDSANGQFEIISNTGVILLSKPLDRGSKDSYTLTVEAVDQGSPLQLSSLITMHINVLDINDNLPIFLKSFYYGNISESALPGTEILEVRANSIDIGVYSEIIYHIVRGNEDGRFHVDSSSGMLSVLQPLDYEHIKDYILIVEATVRGEISLSSQTFVNISVIDFNDNPPLFMDILYTVSIPEDIHVGKTIIQVLATDMDSGNNGIISYTIEEGDLYKQFNIDNNSGYITVIRPLDREMVPEYKLIVRASDSGIPSFSSTATVIVELLDINDNAPVFSQNNYTAVIQEGKDTGTFIIKLRVTDEDSEGNGGPFTYDIRGGHGANFFQISNDGTVRSSAVFNRRSHQLFGLYIRVFDSGTPPLFSDSFVSIKVVEESQYPPSIKSMDITVMSYEDSFKGGLIGRVRAVDIDKYDTLTYKIESENDYFLIDSTSGDLTLSPNTDIGQYKVNISVFDGKFKSYAIFNVKILPIWTDMLSSAVSLRLKGVSAEHFIVGGCKTLISSLKSALKTDILLLSINPGKRELDVLISIVGGTELTELNESFMELGLPTITLNCSCQNDGICRQRITILPYNTIITSIDTYSFVSPAHKCQLYCYCMPAYTGERCESNLEDSCDCPPPMVCSHMGSVDDPFVCSSPPPVAPLCALNHTCQSSNYHTLSSGSFNSNYIIVLFIMVLTIAFAATVMALRKRLMRRKLTHKNEEKVFHVPSADEKCSKLINLPNAKHAGGQTSCGAETMYVGIRLKDFEKGCSHAPDVEELEKIPPHCGQSSNQSNDLIPNITNGYRWQCSDWMHANRVKLPNIEEVPGSEISSASVHSNDSTNHQTNGHVKDPLLRYSLSGEDISRHDFPPNGDSSV